MVDQLREEDNSKPEPVPEQQLADVITSHNPGNYWVCHKARLEINHWGGHLVAGIWAPPSGEEDRQFMVHLQRLKWHHGDHPGAVWCEMEQLLYPTAGPVASEWHSCKGSIEERQDVQDISSEKHLPREPWCSQSATHLIWMNEVFPHLLRGDLEEFVSMQIDWSQQPRE